METLLVPDDLDRHRLPGAVITAMKHLSEGALTQGVDDLVTVSQVVAVDNLVVSPLVVVAVVVGRVIGCCHLFLAPGANVVYRFVVQDLLALVLGQPARLFALEDS